MAVQIVDARMTLAVDMHQPQIGGKLITTETIALALANTARALGCQIDYTARSVPALALAEDLTDTEMYGLDMPREVIKRALEVRGIDNGAGVDIDRIHAVREAKAA